MNLLTQLKEKLLTRRFIRFAAVGLSGVVVNLSVLALLARGLGLQPRIASAGAIEVSILWNFLWNNAWTFKDRNAAAKAGVFTRLVRYNGVSLVGGGVAWITFVSLSALAVLAFDLEEPGGWIYPAQLCGIGIAMVWNFLTNFFWTWAQKLEAEDPDAVVTGDALGAAAADAERIER